MKDYEQLPIFLYKKKKTREVFIEGTRFVSRKSFRSERINEMVHKWIKFSDNGDISHFPAKKNFTFIVWAASSAFSKIDKIFILKRFSMKIGFSIPVTVIALSSIDGEFPS